MIPINSSLDNGPEEREQKTVINHHCKAAGHGRTIKTIQAGKERHMTQ
jgi:hypothetical protein